METNKTTAPATGQTENVKKKRDTNAEDTLELIGNILVWIAVINLLVSFMCMTTGAQWGWVYFLASLGGVLSSLIPWSVFKVLAKMSKTLTEIANKN